MHMYRVIQSSPRGLDSIVSLHGRYDDAEDYVNLLDTVNDGSFTYWVDYVPVEVTTSEIVYEEGV